MRKKRGKDCRTRRGKRIRFSCSDGRKTKGTKAEKSENVFRWIFIQCKIMNLFRKKLAIFLSKIFNQVFFLTQFCFRYEIYERKENGNLSDMFEAIIPVFWIYRRRARQRFDGGFFTAYRVKWAPPGWFSTKQNTHETEREKSATTRKKKWMEIQGVDRESDGSEFNFYVCSNTPCVSSSSSLWINGVFSIFF